MSIIKREKQNWQTPFDALTHLREEMNTLFNRTLNKRQGNNKLWDMNFSPEVDMVDNGKELSMKVDLPGFKKEDINVSLVGNFLKIRGERKEEHEDKKKNTYYMERRFGSFERSFELPCAVKETDVNAEYKGGVLRVTIPKCESETVKKISVDIK